MKKAAEPILARPEPAAAPRRARHSRLSVLFLFPLFLFAAPAPAQILLTDAQGIDMERYEPARRIVSLSATATEILYAAGAGDHVLATVQGTQFPPEAVALPRLGSAGEPDLQAIRDRHADLLVVSLNDNSPEFIARLRSLGLPVFALWLRRPEDIPEAVEQLGWLARTEAVAGLTAYNLREDIRRLRQRWRSAAREKIAVVLDPQQATVAGPEHYLQGALEVCGFRKVFADGAGMRLRADAEQLRAAAPRWLLVEKTAGKGWRQHAPWRDLQAVKEGRVYSMQTKSPAITGPRLIHDLAHLCDTLRRKNH